MIIDQSFKIKSQSVWPRNINEKRWGDPMKETESLLIAAENKASRTKSVKEKKDENTQ